MLKSIVVIFTFLIVFSSCKETSKEKKSPKEKEVPEKKAALQVYTYSEMAAFMEEMYKEHKTIKRKLEAGEKIDSLPYNLLDLHTKTFTTPSDYDATYRQFATAFIEVEKLIVSDTSNALEHYNQAINLCISCHQIKCTGPIPRIKKLKIPIP